MKHPWRRLKFVCELPGLCGILVSIGTTGAAEWVFVSPFSVDEIRPSMLQTIAGPPTF